MDLDLELASSFLVLIDEEHYGRAAARLNVTGPALTKRIQRLEQQLGVVLIERGPGGISGITRAGLRFAQAAAPLMSHAQDVVIATRAEPKPSPLRVGVPAGTGEFLQIIKMRDLVRNLRREHPDVRIVPVNVPFPSLRGCLGDGHVDVLLTIDPVRDNSVESSPMAVTANRVGVVHAHHPLADAGAMRAEQLCEELMVFNPAAPAEFMDPFWLSDIRPRREARLLEVGANDLSGAMNSVDSPGMMISLDRIRKRLPAHLKPISLLDAPPVRFYAAHRRNDHRQLVQVLVAKLENLQPIRF
ncbi:LysR family transcriptional regulator [Kribbella sp. CA-245084]|uniref:LysR family transcriptional regulator n=1 Tax=Kribbella sp. CA-245084 TaxID=3239940 RepID=UPI003D8DBF5B